MDVLRDGFSRGLAFSWALGRVCIFSYYVFEALLTVGVRATHARPVALIVAAADFCLQARRNPVNILLLIYVGVGLERMPTMISQMIGDSQALDILWLSFMGALVYSIVSNVIREIFGALLELVVFVQRWWRPAVPGDREDQTHDHDSHADDSA
jgi:uncharacterized membrane protein YvlD (DUF360 family)